MSEGAGRTAGLRWKRSPVRDDLLAFRKKCAFRRNVWRGWGEQGGTLLGAIRKLSWREEGK